MCRIAVRVDEPPRPRVRRPRRVSLLDVSVLVLALVSVGLLGYVAFFPHSEETAHLVSSSTP